MQMLHAVALFLWDLGGAPAVLLTMSAARQLSCAYRATDSSSTNGCLPITL